MSDKPWKAQGLAILEYFKGKENAAFIAHSDDGDLDQVRAGLYFRKLQEFPEIEKAAIDLCRGKVLDIGAGAGCHSLELQERGFDVTAIDISPEAVAVMEKRGVKNALCVDYRKMKEGDFDTLLLMMNGIGIVGDLQGLKHFLNQAKLLTKVNGQIICDSLDLTGENYNISENPVTRKIFPNRDLERIRNSGQLKYIFEYQNSFYPSFDWLFLSPDRLSKYARETGWHSEIIQTQDDGKYLAHLTR